MFKGTGKSAKAAATTASSILVNSRELLSSTSESQQQHLTDRTSQMMINRGDTTTISTTTTSNNSPSEQQFLSSIDQLLSNQPGFSESISRSSSSMFKIIDIQRSKRKSGHIQTSTNDNDNIQLQQQQQQQQQSWSQQQGQQPQQTTTTNQQQQQQQQDRPHSSNNNQHQKQQSGETLSSFESDYDLLVYLGETETEDIVDTERSLDYQDQTWRQSICGGASLAPTIDDYSFNEGFLSGHNSSNANYPQYQQQQQHHQLETITAAAAASIRDNDDENLLNTPTPTAATFGASNSPFFTLSNPTVLGSNIITPGDNRQSSSGAGAGAAEATTTRSLAQFNRPVVKAGDTLPNNYISNRADQPNYSSSSSSSASYLRRAEELNAESDDCDNEISLVFHKQQINNSKSVKPVARINVNQRNPKQQQQQENILQQKNPVDYQRQLAVKQISDAPTSPLINQQQQQAQKSASTNIGNKLVSLFNRRSEQKLAHKDDITIDHSSNKFGVNLSSMDPNYLERKMPETSTSGRGGGRTLNDEAAELDRLLAEMNDSLDLNSLARYDPMAGQSRYAQSGNTNNRYEQQRQHQIKSQTLNPRNSSVHQQLPYHAPQIDLMNQQKQKQKQQQSINNTSNQKSVSLANVKQQVNIGWPSSSNSKQKLVAESESSILDEYDGASKILEQMISDQLMNSSKVSIENKRRQKQQQQQPPEQFEGTSKQGTGRSMASSPVNNSADGGFPDGRDRTRSIDNESPNKTSSSTRKVSTCSSSTLATEASVVLANPLISNQQEQESERRALLLGKTHRQQSQDSSNRKLVKQSSSFDQGQLPSSGIISLSSRPSTAKYPIALVNNPKQSPASRSFDLTVEPNLTPPVTGKIQNKSNNNNNPNSIQREEEERPPTPPEVDYINEPIIVMHEVDLEDGKVIRLEPADIPSSDDFGSSEMDERVSKLQPTTNETQMNKMKRKTLSSMRSMRNKFNDLITINNKANNNNMHHHQVQDDKATTTQQPIKLINRIDDKSASRSQQQKRAPQPPKRSSSMGSQSSLNNNNKSSRDTSQNRLSRLEEQQRVVPGQTPMQQRESRSRAPREKQPKQSFGQQIRERLSRSKSRFSKFLHPSSSSARAQSSPNIKDNKPPLPPSGIEQVLDDSELFQPSDIARNSGESEAAALRSQRDSFDESLDRHLAASLDAENKKKKNKKISSRSSSSSSSSSSSVLSGLDKEKPSSVRSRPRSRTKRGGTNVQSDREKSKEKRPSSLISLRRLGSFRSKPKQTQPPIEDYDSMQVKTTSDIPTAASRAKRSSRKPNQDRAQTKSPPTVLNNNNSSGESSKVSSINYNQKLLAKTDDYFGKETPLKAEDSEEKLSTHNHEADLNYDNLKTTTTLKLPTRINISGNISPTDNRSAKSWVCEPTKTRTESSKDKAISKQPVIRSQSMKSISIDQQQKNKEATTTMADKGTSADKGKLQSGNRTVSFSNLQQQQQQQQRRLPSTVNTFRPASACAQMEQHPTSARLGDDTTQQAELSLTPTPIGLSSDPFVGRRLESVKPPQLDHHQSRLEPIRAKGAAMIDDIKHKCSELFQSSASDSGAVNQQQHLRGRQSRDTALSVPPSSSSQVRSDKLPPVRPPRKRGLYERSKSVSGRPAIKDALDDEQLQEDDEKQQHRTIYVRPATPGSSLNRGRTMDSTLINTDRSQQQQQQLRHRQSPMGEKLASFAQQLKHSAADFFHQPTEVKRNQPVDGSSKKATAVAAAGARAPTVIRSPDETIVPSDDLCDWKPVIVTTNRRPTSLGRSSFRLLGAKDGESLMTNDDDDDQEVRTTTTTTTTMADHNNEQQQHSSLDSDSTWESTTGDDEEAIALHKNNNIGKKIVNAHQTKSDHLGDDSSSRLPVVLNEPNNNLDERQQQQQLDEATTRRIGMATAATAVVACKEGRQTVIVEGGGEKSSNRLCGSVAKAAVGHHKFDDMKCQDTNNNDNETTTGKELLHSSEQQQQQQQRHKVKPDYIDGKRVHVRADLDAVVSEDNLEIIQQQQQQKPPNHQVEQAKEAIISSRGKSNEHEARPLRKNIYLDDDDDARQSSVANRQQQPSISRNSSSSNNNNNSSDNKDHQSTRIYSIESKPFKFNANLPLPSQLLQEENTNENTAPVESNSSLKSKLTSTIDADIADIASSRKEEILGKNSDEREEERKNDEHKMTRVSLRPKQLQQSQKEVDTTTQSDNSRLLQQQQRQQQQKPQEDSHPENRLSIYENVSESEVLSPDNCFKSPPKHVIPSSTSSLSSQTGTSQVGKRRQWRRNSPESPAAAAAVAVARAPPHVPAKPSHLTSSYHGNVTVDDLVESISEKIQPPPLPPHASCSSTAQTTVQPSRKSSTSDDDDDDWSTSGDVVDVPKRLSPREKAVELEHQPATTAVAATEPAIMTKPMKSSKPKLVTMTSIIHDSMDDLMEARPASGRISSISQNNNNNDNRIQSTNMSRVSSSGSLLQRRDSNFGTDDADSDDTDSSFAAAAESRQRLVRKFEQKGSLPRLPYFGTAATAEQATTTATTTTTKAKFPAFNEGKTAASSSGRGESLVKRLARNFDQSVQDQQSSAAVGAGAASSRRPPVAPAKRIVQTTTASTTIMKSFDDDSTADWCDARGSNLAINEDEIAEFLQDFDRNLTTTIEQNRDHQQQQQQQEKEEKRPASTVTLTEISASQEASEACSSVSTGADPYVTIAESTLDEVEANDDDDDEDYDDDYEDQQLNGYAERQQAIATPAAMGTTSDDDTLNDGELRDEDNDNVLMENDHQTLDDYEDEDDLTESYISAHGTLPRAGENQQQQGKDQSSSTTATAATTTTTATITATTTTTASKASHPASDSNAPPVDVVVVGVTRQQYLPGSRVEVKESRFMSASERHDDDDDDDKLLTKRSPIETAVALNVLLPQEENIVSISDDYLPVTTSKLLQQNSNILIIADESLSLDHHSNNDNNNIKNTATTTTEIETEQNTQSSLKGNSSSSSSKGSRESQSRVAQSDKGDKTNNKSNNNRTNLIDDHFKNSLNHIIARRSSSSNDSSHSTNGQVMSNNSQTVEQEGSIQQQKQVKCHQKQMSEPIDRLKKDDSSKKQSQKESIDKDKSKSSRQAKGLSRFYRALLGLDSNHNQNKDSKEIAKKKKKGHKQRRKKKGKYTHSSTSSSTCSSISDNDDEQSLTTTLSDPEGDDDEDEEPNISVDAAKKCSRIYEELERILLERRLAMKENREPGMKQEPARVGDVDDNDENENDEDDEALEGRDDMGYELDYEESLSAIMVDAQCEERNQHQHQHSSGEDRVSLSSSSMSSESIPEIRQRKNLQKLYHVVNEICTSEAKFVDTLRLLNVDFRQHIMNCSSSSSSNSVISVDRLNSMLKHLPQLQALNENLLAELEQARSQWPQTQKIAHVLVKIGPFLKHYSTYIREFESMQQQYNENLKKYPQFADRVREFETSERCKKLTIQHHILKPIQRIPQYRLLLQQYLHNLKPDDVDYEDTVNALEVVSRVAEHANQSMSEGINFAKLLALQAKIVGKQRDIVQPGRVFIKEGELMKVCRKQIQPRWFVLLNDALLYLTQVQSSDILFLKNELPLDGCLVSMAGEEAIIPAASKSDAPVSSAAAGKGDNNPEVEGEKKIALSSSLELDKEFSVSTRTRSFALIAKTKTERDEWVMILRRTVEEYMAKRRSFISSIHRQQRDNKNQLSSSSMFSPEQSFSQVEQQQQHQTNSMIEEAAAAANHQQRKQQHLLGQMAPIWTPDSRVSMCQLCTSSFSALFRRHHCRACGRVVCSACSSNKAPLIYLKCRTARVCDECFDTLKANIHLYYLPPNSSGSLGDAGSRGGAVATSLSDRLLSCGLEPLIGEEELRRLDEHFRTLLKSQFTRTTSLNKLVAASGANSGGKKNTANKTKKIKQNKIVCPLLQAVTSAASRATTPQPQ